MRGRKRLGPLFVGVFAALAACGEKPGPKVSVTVLPESAWAEPAVADMVFQITNVPVGGFMLDQPPADGHPDTFIYPRACGTTFPAHCGLTKSQHGVVEIGDLPLNYRYEIIVALRDAEGKILHRGSQQFDNSSAGASVTVTVSAEASP